MCAQAAADRVFLNAKVYSVALDGAETRAQAVAVKDGRIVYVGTDEGAQAWVGEGTQVTHCDGNTLMPGLCDAHMHFAMAVNRFGVADLTTILPGPGDTPDDIIKQIQDIVAAFAADHPDDPVIKGNGWDRAWFTGAVGGIVRPFTRHDLDAVVPDRPVVLSGFCGHVVMLNTAALKVAGIFSPDTPEPPAGIMRREPDGTPDGYLQEPVLYAPIINGIPGFADGPAQLRASLERAQDMLAQKGYTLVADCMMVPGPYQVLHDMAEEDALKVRVFGVWGVNDATREADLQRAVENRTRFDVEDRFVVDTCKYFLDGSMAMTEPYTDAYCDREGLPHGTSEPLLWDESHFMEAVSDAIKAGFNVHVHVMGDYGTKVCVDAMVEACQHDPQGRLRRIVAHDTFVNDAEKERMGRYGIIASNQPAWMNVTKETDPVYLLQFGPERLHAMYPCKSLMDAGVTCAFGSDFPVDIPFGLAGLQVAMTRRSCPNHPGYPLYGHLPAEAPEERISLRQAVQAHTINGAYQFRIADVTGSIEVGKWADMVLLDGDLEATPAGEISGLGVAETLLRGRTTYRA